jgi:hypothetical protein
MSHRDDLLSDRIMSVLVPCGRGCIVFLLPHPGRFFNDISHPKDDHLNQ